MGFWKDWKSRPVAKYRIEPRDVQWKIMRTHIAAMTGEIGNLRTQLTQQEDRLRLVIERTGRLIELAERAAR